MLRDIGSRLRQGPVTDAVFLVLLLLLGLLGFKSTYGDYRYLLAAAAGLLLGLVIAGVGDRLRVPSFTVAAAGVLAYFLFGGAVALRDISSAGPIPSLGSVESLMDGAVRGWRELLTVLPPVGASGNVLVIPYLLGLAGAMLAYWLARRTRNAILPVLPPVGVLALSILFGNSKPVAVVLQGAVFAAVTLMWIAVRSRTATPSLARTSRRRPLAAAAMLAVAGAGSVLVGPALPFASARERVVLRDHVDPPLDLRDHVSPLASYRKYAVPLGRSGGRGGLGDQALFTVEGLPPGALIRIGAMDAYDGSVWNVAGAAPSSEPATAAGSGAFLRVGDRIPTTATGSEATVTFTIQALGGVWLPTAGTVTRARFSGASADFLARTFRYNRATDSAVAATLPVGDPVRLRPGDRYTLDVVLAPTAFTSPPPDPARLAAAAPATTPLPEPARVPEALKAKVNEVVGGTQGTFARVQLLADELGRGAFSNGTVGEIQSLAGHSAARLDRMVSDPQGLVGDAEQYAAAMALMVRQLGIPARVVLGVRPTAGNAVRRAVMGTDVTAWVEVGLEGVGWTPVFPTPPSTARKPQTVPRPKPITRVQEPPKTPIAPRVATDPLISPGEPTTKKRAEEKKDPADDQKRKQPARRPRSVGVVVAMAVGSALVALLALVVLTTIALKWRRSRRRRRTGPPSARIAGGWAEVLDRARDAGHQVPPGTRLEVAASLPQADVMLLARRADAAVFAPGEPTEQQVDAYWDDVSTAQQRVGGRGLVSRIKVALNPASLRR